MKRIGLLAFTLLLTPAVAAAQQPPGGPPADPPAMGAHSDEAPSPERLAAMRQMRQQMQQFRQQERGQTLAALSPLHRTLVANVIGGLAIAPVPDLRAAAQQLDAALSPGEKQAIVNAATVARNGMLNLMQARRAQFEATLSPEQRATADQRAVQMQAERQVHPQSQDPGALVIRTLGEFGGPRGPHGPM